jgi:hypothetical protein
MKMATLLSYGTGTMMKIPSMPVGFVSSQSHPNSQPTVSGSNGGPDTACRTVWEDGIECVSVPLDSLRAALDGAE